MKEFWKIYIQSLVLIFFHGQNILPNAEATIAFVDGNCTAGAAWVPNPSDTFNICFRCYCFTNGRLSLCRWNSFGSVQATECNATTSSTTIVTTISTTTQGTTSTTPSTTAATTATPPPPLEEEGNGDAGGDAGGDADGDAGADAGGDDGGDADGDAGGDVGGDADTGTALQSASEDSSPSTLQDSKKIR